MLEVNEYAIVSSTVAIGGGLAGIVHEPRDDHLDHTRCVAVAHTTLSQATYGGGAKPRL